MTDKEFKRLRRAELVEIVYELQKQNEEKDKQIQALQAQLDERVLQVSTAGSIAEAALRVNKVFEAAQAAADQYLLSLQYQGRPRQAAPAAANPGRTQAKARPVASARPANAYYKKPSGEDA